MTEEEIKEIQGKLYQKLMPSGWGTVLKTFMMSQEMGTLISDLIEQSEGGRKFTPKLKQVFRAFEECPYDKLKVVIILQDPYPGLYKGDVTVADGIAMSVSNSMRIQPSLEFVHKAIRKTVYPGREYQGPLDLKVWSNQGILMLNTALTTTVGKVGIHYGLWKPFMVFLLDMLSWTNGGLIYCYLGQKAREYSKLTNDNCHRLYASHPISAGYRNEEEWDSNGIFLEVNRLLIKEGKEPITW